jgi:hypothetical protein
MDRLATARYDECRRAAAILQRLERTGAVSVWTEADTTGGMVFFGASYLDSEGSPIAVQFWAPTFQRSIAWVAGAIAHEGFHLLRPRATEDESLRFGLGCRALVTPDRSAPPIAAGAGFFDQDSH